MSVAPVTGATLPARLLDRARQSPEGTAYRHKRRGVWETGTWAAFAADAAAIGLALGEMGIGGGDRVAIAADNRPEWLVADLGAQGIGAATVGVDPASSAREVHAVLASSRTRVVVCEDEEQLDKVMEVRAGLPDLVAAVVVDPRGVRRPDDPMVSTWADVLSHGRALDPAAWEAKVAALGPGAQAVVATASGAELTSERQAAAGADLGPEADRGTRHEVLSTLSLCHPAERAVSLVDALAAGSVVNFGEGGESFPQDLREVQPTVLVGLPAMWERMQAETEVRANGASLLKRSTYRWCMAQGRALAARRAAAESRATDPALRALCGLICLGQLRRKLGLSRLTTARSAAAPLAPATHEWFSALGLEVAEAADA